MTEDYKNLGYANGWETNPMPLEYLDCCIAKHQRREINISKCQKTDFL